MHVLARPGSTPLDARKHMVGKQNAVPSFQGPSQQPDFAHQAPAGVLKHSHLLSSIGQHNVLYCVMFCSPRLDSQMPSLQHLRYIQVGVPHLFRHYSPLIFSPASLFTCLNTPSQSAHLFHFFLLSVPAICTSRLCCCLQL